MKDDAGASRERPAGGDTRPFGIAAHIVGNVLLGLSLGLFAYYGITDVQARVSQAGFDDALLELGAIAEPAPSLEPTVVAPAQPTAWLDWGTQDATYWLGLGHGDVFGRLVIPAIDLDTVVVFGTDREDLKLGPGWIIQTDMPGPTGNCGISGHRTTYGSPFRDIDALGPGDTIEFYSPYRRYRYEVTEQLVVRPDQTEVVASTEEPMLTLTACHPPYSAAYRIVVHAALLDVTMLVPGEAGGA